MIAGDGRGLWSTVMAEGGVNAGLANSDAHIINNFAFGVTIVMR